mmetsp:Transcript_5677/g.9222  ORF Transcript_5677/g.9222 Transcript_5677/m.9222 type:complete len:226 (-) Transcript_5677:751-1428(-)
MVSERCVASVSTKSPSARRASGKSSAAIYNSAISILLSAWPVVFLISALKRLIRASGVSSGAISAKAAARSGCGCASQAFLIRRVALRGLPFDTYARDAITAAGIRSGDNRFASTACSCVSMLASSASSSFASDSAKTASRRRCTSRGNIPWRSFAFSVPRAPFQSLPSVCRRNSVSCTSTWRGFSAKAVSASFSATSVLPASSFCFIRPRTPTNRVRSSVSSFL